MSEEKDKTQESSEAQNFDEVASKLFRVPIKEVRELEEKKEKLNKDGTETDKH